MSQLKWVEGMVELERRRALDDGRGCRVFKFKVEVG